MVNTRDKRRADAFYAAFQREAWARHIRHGIDIDVPSCIVCARCAGDNPHGPTPTTVDG
jgi:hypothetical protein